MKVSLITVCYNAESLIEETLQSAVSQTFRDFELVIVDGGSTDATVQKARKFETHIGTLISEKDAGIYDAMNKGVRAAKGEFVYFLNAGDAFFDNKVLEDIFTDPENLHSDFIYGLVQTKNEPTGINYLNGKKVALPAFYSHYPICHQATFTRKTLFEKLGYFDLSFPLVSDSEWFIRVFKDQALKRNFTSRIIAYYDIQGATYHKRMKGYREYLRVGFRHFPIHFAILNVLLYPVIWTKVWIIRTFQGMAWFHKYREYKFRKRMAIESNTHSK